MIDRTVDARLDCRIRAAPASASVGGSPPTHPGPATSPSISRQQRPVRRPLMRHGWGGGSMARARFPGTVPPERNARSSSAAWCTRRPTGKRSAELEPLLALLAETEAEVAHIRAAAQQGADLRRRRSRTGHRSGWRPQADRGHADRIAKDDRGSTQRSPAAGVQRAGTRPVLHEQRHVHPSDLR
jgi:hypothetical protein